MRQFRGRRLWLAAVSALALGVAPTAAQSVIAFGDSLSDNGNLFAVTGGRTPVSPPYFAGRFSNGPTFSEIVAGGPMQTAGAFALGGVPIDFSADQNYAFGGARTDSAVDVPPGIPTQIDLFQARGGRFSPGDLVLLNGGPNNVFQAFAAVARGADPATIGAASLAAAGDLATSADRLARLGAPTLAVINMPDLGATPRLGADPLVANLASQATSAFNASLSSRIDAVAAANPGTNLYLVDIVPLLRDAIDDPGRYGFTNVTQACISVPTCAAGSREVQNGYLYFDDVHPTAPGHELFGLLVLDYLTAGAQAGQAAALSEVALSDRLAGESAVRERARAILASTNAIAQGADLADPGAAAASWGGAYLSVEGARFDRDASDAAAGYDYRAGTLRLGADYRLSDAVILGGAVSALTGEARDTPFAFDAQSFSADLYGTLVSGPAFLTLSGGVAHVDFDDIRRQTLVPQIVNEGGNTDGFAANVGAEVGYGFEFGMLTATPTLGLSYVHFDVDGFDESGIGARVVFEGYDRDVVYGAANLHLAYASSLAGRRAVFTGRIGYEDALSDGGDDGIVSTIAGSPSQASFAAFDDVPGRGFVLGAGAEVDLTDALALSAKYSAGFGDEIGNSHAGSATLSYRF
jgi:outer membrane lipase/esterase